MPLLKSELEMSETHTGKEADLYAVAMIQVMRDPLLVLDNQRRVKFANRSFYDVFRPVPEHTLERPFDELGNRQWNRAPLLALLDNFSPASGGFDDFEVEHDFPEIGLRTMLLTGRWLYGADADTSRVLVTIKDVTHPRAIEHKLELSEVRYRRLFEAAHDGILILNATTRQITEVNPFILQLLGYPRDYFLGKELWEIGIFADKAANQQAIEELHTHGTIRFEHLPLLDRNGHRHPVEIVANIYQEGPDQVIQCNIRDIGDRVRFEREREALLVNEQAARMEAEAANRSKDLFLATLSHEVRTPLNAILGWATILRDGKCSEEDLKEGMEVIERNCRMQAQLIDDVLDVSRIVSGNLRLEICRCELAGIISAAIDAVRPAAKAKHLSIESVLDLECSVARCDASRMQQVFWNLLTNAVKFSPAGRTVRILLDRPNSSTRIRITDEGQGISPAFLPYVFDRFRQADGSTQRKFGGLGLGLAIVKHIVEAHGGTVEAQSEGEGRGATFTVNLPTRAVSDDRENGNADHGFAPTLLPELIPVRLDLLRVMVVDDEADARRLLVKVLAEAGAVVTAVSSVVQAMAELANANPEVLVSDIAMPGQDGYELIRQIRSTGLNAKTLPAIALTAFAHKDDRRRALLAGFQVHVSKPIDPHDLQAVIATLAGRTG
jgi:PAS domain S-box-containing protein